MAKENTVEAPPAPSPPPSKEEEAGGQQLGKDYDSDYYSDDSDDEYEDEDVEAMLTPEEREELERQRSEKREERRKRIEEEAERKRLEEEVVEEDELWNFPIDKENWTEQDLGEHWEDYWGDIDEVGWDPDTITEEELEYYQKLKKEGKPGPPMTPYYVPYRKFYPPIPDNHHDIQTPEDVVEELERMEEFLIWVSYVFKDGSSYEGTVWDDLAYGKGVYTTPFEMCRYEGEWFENMMEGHGVLEVTIPVTEPVPDTPAYFKAKKAGRIMRSDYMNPFDREWLKMHAQELFKKYGEYTDPFFDEGGWIMKDGTLPPKGKYKYSGQWKHNRFHGCGVYEINGLTIWGKFYFGEMLPYKEECSAQTTALHSSLAEVAAAKAKMFVNKPDGMVRETRGPFSDPSHPYMYEEEDLWMAPGFINAYYEVPPEWKLYVEDLDKEREMWLNSFTKTPFTIPMPPELEYWWSQEDEFVVLGNTPSVMGDRNPLNRARARKDRQGKVLLHVPTGTIINWAQDKQGHLRFFFTPLTEKGEDIDPDAAIPLPLGFDEYMKDETEDSSKDVKEKNFFQKLKESWDKSKEEYEQDRKNRKEELEKKWKEQDEVTEMRKKLRLAERYLAWQIKIEEMLAKKREKEGITADGEIVDQEKQEETDENGGIEEADKAEQDGESTYKEEKKDEDEKVKKPKSFGKVAMAGINEYEQLNGTSKEQRFNFPTAFASLSMGPKMVLNDVINSRFGRMLSTLLPRSGHMLSHIQTVNDVENTDFPTINFTEGISFRQERHYYHLRLRVSYASSSSYRKPCVPITMRGTPGAQKSRKINCIRHQGIWSEPENEFLSLAIPVKQ